MMRAATLQHEHHEHHERQPLNLHLKAIIGINNFLRFIEEMPMAQGIIVMTAFGITMGSWMFTYTAAAIIFTKIITIFAVFGLGGWTLYLLQFDRRREKQMLSVGIIMLMISNIMYLVNYKQDIFLILHNGSIVLIMLFLFIIGIHGYVASLGDRP